MKIPRRMKKNFKEKSNGVDIEIGLRETIHRGNDQWKLDAKSIQK